MIISYRAINIIALATLLPITCFGMQQQSICKALPIEINKITFNFLNLHNQDQLRATCFYWKKIGDERSSYLLDLLHSPSNTTLQTKIRILFDAVYNSNYDLAEHMLKVTPQHHLNHPVYSATNFDLYSLAQKNSDKKIINLMGEYKNFHRNDDVIKHIEHPALLELLISCISGNMNSVKRVMDVEFKTSEVCNKIKKDNKYTRGASWIIQYAFDFATFYDDEQCILAYKEFLKDNHEMNWMIDKNLKHACQFKSKKAFKALLQQKNPINEITEGSYNGTSTMTTIKNVILGGTIQQAHSVFDGDKQYRDEIEAIFNECGAKTYEELEAEKNSQA